jgi:LmeA-like phospholipid-binding
MSSDPTQPVPEWWQQPQAPKKEQGAQKDKDPQDSQATRQYPTSQGSPARPTFTPSQGNQSDQRYQPDQGYPSGPGFPSGPGYQQDQDYPGNQGYQGPPGAPTYPANQGFPAGQDYQGTPARVRRRRRRWAWITLLVIVLVLVGGDFAAKAYAENQMASQVQSSLALSGKPNVTIQGFPFLTQVASRTFNTVDVNASNETAGPGGQLQIASLTATLHGMHIHGTNSATVDQFTASALVTFTALAHAGGIPQGITLAPAGPNQLKATVDILGFSSDATAKVTQVGSDKINVKITDFAGIPADVLGNLTDFTFSIPKLPAGVKIQSISVTQQGLRITATGQNTTLSQ